MKSLWDGTYRCFATSDEGSINKCLWRLLAVWILFSLIVLVSTVSIYEIVMQQRVVETFNRSLAGYSDNLQQLQHRIDERLTLLSVYSANGASSVEGPVSVSGWLELAQQYQFDGAVYFMAKNQKVTGVIHSSSGYQPTHSLPQGLSPQQLIMSENQPKQSRWIFLNQENMPLYIHWIFRQMPAFDSQGALVGWLLYSVPLASFRAQLTPSELKPYESNTLFLTMNGLVMAADFPHSVFADHARPIAETLVPLEQPQSAGGFPQRSHLSILHGSWAQGPFQLGEQSAGVLLFLPFPLLFQQMGSFVVLVVVVYLLILALVYLISRQFLQLKVTERKQRLAKEIQDAVFDSSLLLILIEANGSIRRINDYALQHFNLEPEEANKTNIDKLITFVPSVKQIVKQAVHHGSWSGDVELTCGQQSVGVVMKASPVFIDHKLSCCLLSGSEPLPQIERPFKMTQRANTDPLTSLYNRGYLEEQIVKELKRCESTGNTLSLVLLDIDHFHKINDKFGHYVGDQVLTDLAELILSCVRGHDVVARWGGEEFVILMPDTDIFTARTLAKKLHEKINELRWDDELSCSCSFGITGWEAGTTASELFQQADDMLYQAKAAGRNQLCCWGMVKNV